MDTLKNLRKNDQLKFKVKKETKRKIVAFARETGYQHTSACIRDIIVQAANKHNEQKQKLVVASATC
jgi:DNA-binding LacI/PurR family transcriptional regulator